jgi:hypothetical protein
MFTLTLTGGRIKGLSWEAFPCFAQALTRVMIKSVWSFTFYSLAVRALTFAIELVEELPRSAVILGYLLDGVVMVHTLTLARCFVECRFPKAGGTSYALTAAG